MCWLDPRKPPSLKLHPRRHYQVTNLHICAINICRHLSEALLGVPSHSTCCPFTGNVQMSCLWTLQIGLCHHSHQNGKFTDSLVHGCLWLAYQCTQDNWLLLSRDHWLLLPRDHWLLLSRDHWLLLSRDHWLLLSHDHAEYFCAGFVE